MSHSLTLSVTSTHSHTCAHVPVLMHTHNTHTYTFPRPHTSLPPSWGSREEPPEDKASWASMPSAHGDRGGGGGKGRGGRETLQGSPWVWAELLGSPSSFSGSPTSPLPTDTPLPQSFALRTSGRKWHLDPPSCSVITGVQDRRLALCHGAARKKASLAFLLEPRSTHSCAFDSIGWTQARWHPVVAAWTREGGWKQPASAVTGL